MRKLVYVACFLVGILLMLYGSSRAPRTAAASSKPSVAAPETGVAVLRSAVVLLGSRTTPQVTQYGSPDGPAGLLARSEPPPPIGTPAPSDADTASDDGTSEVRTAWANAGAHGVPEPSPLTHPDDATGASPDHGEPVAGDDTPQNHDGDAGPDTPPDREDDASPGGPVVDAGRDVTVWSGDREIALAGSATSDENVTYKWEQTRGPEARIATAGSAETTVAFPEPAFDETSSWKPTTYEFKLTATDSAGRKGHKSVRYRVRTAPDVVVTPLTEPNHRTDKYFQSSDGVPLATFESVVHTPANYPTRFVIDAESALTLEPATAGQFESSHYEENSRHLYILAVYQSAAEAVTRIDLYAKTEEGIPAVISLSVEW